MDLADKVFDYADAIQRPQTYALVNQLYRSALSIPSNIAEGYGRRSRAEFIRFLRIANGSLRELETQLLLASRRGHEVDRAAEALALADDVGRLMTGLDRALVAWKASAGLLLLALGSWLLA